MSTTQMAGITGITEIALDLAIQKRDAFRAQGIKCQLRYIGDDLWNVLLAGIDY